MVLCLYNTSPSDYLNHELEGMSTRERVAQYASLVSALDEVESLRVCFLTTGPVGLLPDGWDVREVAPLTQQSLIELLSELVHAGPDELLVAFADQPFLNSELTSRLLARHRDYLAQYTFADGYPAGLAPELLSPQALSHLASLAGDELVDRRGLFPIVQKDINRLDVETELSPVDQRLLRLELAVNTRANLLLCERLAAGAPSAIDEWPDHVEGRRTEHRTLPSFVSVQVVEEEVQRLAYSPYPLVRDAVTAPGRTMPVERFDELVSDLERFAPEAVVHLSLWGEIARHPDALSLIRRVLASDSLRVLVETSGVGWDEAQRDELFSLRTARFMLIVGLDTNDPELYRSIRGEGFEEAQAFARAAFARIPEQTWVQAVRSDLTEPALDAFYRSWKERTQNIIIQKYDYFSGTLPQRRIGDIAPIRRFPCWHLQRDLYVLVDGTAALCREDIASVRGRAGEAIGNIFTDGIQAVWQAGAQRFSDHVAGVYEGICEACDEYYTFTF